MQNLLTAIDYFFFFIFEPAGKWMQIDLIRLKLVHQLMNIDWAMQITSRFYGLMGRGDDCAYEFRSFWYEK